MSSELNKTSFVQLNDFLDTYNAGLRGYLSLDELEEVLAESDIYKGFSIVPNDIVREINLESRTKPVV